MSFSCCFQRHICIRERERENICCLTSTEASRPIRDGDEWEKGDRRVKPRNRRQPGRPRLPWTAATMLRQLVSVRHCAVTTAPRNCCPNCYAEQSHKDNVRSSAVGKLASTVHNYNYVETKLVIFYRYL